MYDEQLGGHQAVYGYDWGNVQRSVGSGEEEMSMSTGLLLSVKRDENTRNG